MLPRQKIFTSRLCLRSFSLDDARDLLDYLSDERIYQFDPGAPIREDRAFSTAAKLAASPDYWAVEQRDEQRVIGQVLLRRQEPFSLQTWELGYTISPAYQRKGYAAEAVEALLRYAFQTIQLHRVAAYCSPLNPASWRLLEKLGFCREGLLRENIFFRRDDAGEPVWMDSYLYSLLENDPIVRGWLAGQ